MTTWCKELTHLKRPWCWERLKAGGEGDDRGWDGWMASPTQWTWVWVNSGSWWWTGRPGVLQSMGSQMVGHDWATELNWTFNLRNICICLNGNIFVITLTYSILTQWALHIHLWKEKKLGGRSDNGSGSRLRARNGKSYELLI